MTPRAAAAARDAADPLSAFVEQFVVDDPGLVYLDGNSLGRLPAATRDRLRAAIDDEWGGDLVRGWSRWIDLPSEVGDQLAPLIGAQRGEVLVCDSTTINLYKVVAAVLAARPDRSDVLVPADEFPTDRYVLDGLAAALDRTVRHGGPEDADANTAVVVASVVDYRTGELVDLPAATAAAHRVGAVTCWDLSHAVGSVEVDLGAAGADVGVGCTYKHLCAGPGAPAFLFVRSGLHAVLRSPIWGWFAQRDQFAMGPTFDPEVGVRRYLTGTPNVLGLFAVVEGVQLVSRAGTARLAAKGRALTQLVIELADEWLAPLGFSVASPRDPTRRGAHVALRHPDAYRIGWAARRDANVVVDVRPPDLVRIGPAPISTRFVDVWDGLDRMRELVASGGHLRHAPGPRRVS
jgi:kynureninase